MKIIPLLFLLFVYTFTYSQDHKSIHQVEYEASLSENNVVNNLIKGDVKIIPLNKNSGTSLNKSVFGFLRYGDYTNYKNYLRYDLLTHISVFSFPVSSNGTIGTLSGWPWNDVINAAHSNGVKIIMTATNFTGNDIHNIITNSTAKNNFFNNAKTLIQNSNIDGINIDFEALNTADRGSLINGFMQELTNYLHSAIPGTEVSYAGPAVNWGGWDLAGLASSCDYIFIMGYDFYGSGSTTTGPSAPLTGSGYNITRTLTNTSDGYGTVINTAPHKLILGVPYYGNKWTTETSSAQSKVITYKNAVRFRDAVVEAGTYGRIWEGTSQTPWYRYQVNSEWYQVWYDDQQSLGLKYDLAIAKNLKGVGMWALGYDGARPELWNLIEQKFKTIVPVELISFNAVLQGATVTLNWRTASELNNFGFDIERKAGHEDQFSKIGFIAGNGSTSEPNVYLYKDYPVNLGSGKQQYRLKQIDTDGKYNYSTIAEVILEPADYYLSQNYPNPLNPSTIIDYRIAEDGMVSMKLYNALGKEIKTIINKWHAAGSYQIDFSAEELNSGIYVYTLSAGGNFLSKKMMVLR